MKNQWRYAAVVFCCCSMAMCSIGCAVNCAGLFYQPVAEEFHTGIGSVSMYQTLLCLASGAMGPVAVRVCRGRDIRLVLGLSGGLSVVCYIAMACTTAVWHLYICALLLGAAIAFYGMVIVTFLIGNWFSSFLGAVLGLAQSFSGIGGAVLNPVLSRIMAHWGWRGTYLAIAMVLIVFLSPGMILLRNTPREFGLTPYRSERQSKGQEESSGERTKEMGHSRSGLAHICLIGIMCASCSSMGTHLSGYASSISLPEQLGVFMISAAMVGNFSAKFLIGLMADRIGARRSFLAMIFTAVCGFSVIAFSSSRNGFVHLLTAVLLGTTYSLHSVGLSVTVKELFDSGAFAQMYAMSQLAASVGSAVAFSAIGYSYDFFGTYTVAAVLCIGLLLTAAVVIQCLYRQERRCSSRST